MKYLFFLVLFLTNISMPLLPIYAGLEETACTRALTFVRGASLSAIPFWPTLKPKTVSNLKEQATGNKIVWFKIGDRKHLLVREGSIYLFQPFKDPATNLCCSHRLEVKELKDWGEIRSVLRWGMSFTGGSKILSEQEHLNLDRSLKQAGSSLEHATIMFEDGLEKGLGLTKSKPRFLKTGKGRWIPRMIAAIALLGIGLPPWHWFPKYESEYLARVAGTVSEIDTEGYGVDVGPVGRFILSPLDSALIKLRQINTVQWDDTTPYPLLLKVFVENFQPEKSPTDYTQLIFAINPYIDLSPDALDAWDPGNLNVNIRNVPWGYSPNREYRATNPWDVLFAPHRLQKFNDRLFDSQLFEEAMQTVLQTIPKRTDGKNWKTRPENWRSGLGPEVLVDYPAYFLPNKILAAFDPKRTDMSRNENWDLPAEFIIAMVRSEFARAHPKRSEWLKQMHDTVVRIQTPGKIKEVYPWREIYRGSTGYENDPSNSEH